jgi:uncharacterized membrane protein
MRFLVAAVIGFVATFVLVFLLGTGLWIGTLSNYPYLKVVGGWSLATAVLGALVAIIIESYPEL